MVNIRLSVYGRWSIVGASNSLNWNFWNSRRWSSCCYLCLRVLKIKLLFRLPYRSHAFWVKIKRTKYMRSTSTFYLTYSFLRRAPHLFIFFLIIIWPFSIKFIILRGSQMYLFSLLENRLMLNLLILFLESFSKIFNNKSTTCRLIRLIFQILWICFAVFFGLLLRWFWIMRRIISFNKYVLLIRWSIIRIVCCLESWWLSNILLHHWAVSILKVLQSGMVLFCCQFIFGSTLIVLSVSQTVSFAVTFILFN